MTKDEALKLADWVTSHNEICSLLRQAHDALALTSYPPQRTWVGLTDEEIHMTTVLLGFNPEWKTEIGMTRAIVRNLEAKLKDKNT